MNATAAKMTALEFANDRENVIIRLASQGHPAGIDVAWIPPETVLPFNLDDVEGVILDDGSFEATNLNVVGGAYGWQFRDWRANQVYALWLRVDAKVWAKQYAELMDSD